MIIIIMGMAGSGKSVQAKLLADHLGFEWFSSGDYLRTHMTPKQKRLMASGHLISDREMIKMVEDYLLNLDTNTGVVFDGFPRTTGQASWLLLASKKMPQKIKAILQIKISEQEAETRLLKRSRTDDEKKTIRKRFMEYQTNTAPLIDFFKKQQIPVLEINGEQTVEQVQRSILKALSEAGQGP